jgi:Methylamine utilization protein MauJ
MVFSATTPDGQFEFIGHANEAGFLAKIEFPSFDAQNLHDASAKAFRVLMPALSNISFHLDAPLHIYQIDVTELRTNSRMMSALAPFWETPLFRVPSENLPEEFRKYASLYREAMNSNSPNYQFLCYYKIIEGLLKRRDRIIKEAVQRGETIPSQLRQLIPQTPAEQLNWLNTIFAIPWEHDDLTLSMIFPATSLGRKVRDIVQNELVSIRNKIAHSVLDGGEPTFSIDHGPDIEELLMWLPLAKCIARLYMKNEFPGTF